MNAPMSYEQYLAEVKKGILMDNGLCPVTPLLLMLQGEWKSQICYALCIHDIVRFGMLKKGASRNYKHYAHKLSA